jgi:hypothetical protein
MFNERTAQDTRRQIAEKLAKMEEERALLVQLLADVDAWLVLNGIPVGEQMLPLIAPPRGLQPAPSLSIGKVEKGSLRETFVRIIEADGQRGLTARQVWEAAAARGAQSESTKPERAAAAALGALAKRGIIETVAGKFYPRARRETTEAQAVA